MANAAMPIHLIHAPTHNGMVIPYIALRHADSTPEFGQVSHDRTARCFIKRRCQLCARELGDAAVLMARPQDFGHGYGPEPAQHPECAAYSIRACPMLVGRLPRHRDRTRPQRRQCSRPDACWCGEPPAPPSADTIIRSGRAASPWYSVRFSMAEYEVNMSARKGPRGISLRALTHRKVRLVTWGQPEQADLGRVLMYGLPMPTGGGTG
ncbi:hypothetical protein FAF44_02630 [Nonomuraea sp. MG754425]|uniref:hypothetical protein n=1 Tax=Nonomuraea sp. MG754425 TaxID=2570319 RepID=UPI001F31CF66|nr:hypothetical protein [Nonomuraea sp. MG754425]MCF6467309.1 hypothetical protein [Nonomuraea sp. MG754425]